MKQGALAMLSAKSWNAFSFFERKRILLVEGFPQIEAMTNVHCSSNLVQSRGSTSNGRHAHGDSGASHPEPNQV